jgi:hypothetical protein
MFLDSEVFFHNKISKTARYDFFVKKDKLSETHRSLPSKS